MTVADVVLAERDDAVGIARLNRPDARNALSAELMEALASMSASTGVHPRRASSLAVAAPMPRAPPVIRTTFMPAR